MYMGLYAAAERGEGKDVAKEEEEEEDLLNDVAKEEEEDL